MADRNTLEEIKRLGVYGLLFLGTPPMWDFKSYSRDPSLFSAVWLETNIFGKHVFSYAEIYAVLWVLQFEGMIEIVSTDHGGIDQALWLDFHYTPLGIQTAMERRGNRSLFLDG